MKFGSNVFKPDIVVRHLNGDSLDNSWDNIAIGTQLENIYDIPKEKRRLMGASPRKYDHMEIINDYKNGMTYKMIMEKYNISSKGTVSYIINKSLDLDKIDEETSDLINRK